MEFSSPWDLGACDAPASPVTQSDSPAEKCHEVGTLTVDNLDPAWLVGPDDPDHERDHDRDAPVTPTPVVAAPAFTG